MKTLTSFVVLTLLGPLLYLHPAPPALGEVSGGVLEDVRDDLAYAILTTSDLAEAFRPLAEWKTSKGVPAQIFLLDGEGGVLSSYDGRDEPERIHNFLRDLKERSPSLTWLLLGGDSEIIPCRRLYVNWTYQEGSNLEEDTVISDYYYAGLDSSWDLDGDGVYGEEGEQDFGADLYVGRLPVSNLTEAEGAVQKILRYERDPPPGMWAATALFAGALMDRPNVLDDLSTPIDEGYNDYKDNGYEALQRCLQWVPPEVVPFLLYDYERMLGGGYTPAEDILNRTTFMEYWETGFSVVGTVSHGLSTGEGLVDYKGLSGGFQPLWSDYELYMEYSDPLTLSNGDKLPLLYTSSCASGRFQEEDDTNFEKLVVAPTGGVIGLIGATADTYRGEFFVNRSSYGNWWLFENFFRIFYSGHFRPGEALYLLKEAYENHVWEPQNPYQNQSDFRMYRTDILAYNLLGDPEVPVYTSSPKNFNISHPPLWHVEDQKLEIRIMDEGGEPVEGATVVIFGGELYLRGRSGEDGYVSFQLRPRGLYEVNLTVTAHNFIPFQGKIAITSRVDLAPLGDVEIYPAIPTRGARFYLNFTCMNGGTYPSPGTIVRAWLYDSSGRVVDVTDRYLPSLRGGESYNISLYFVATEGLNRVEVVLDYTGEVLESSEVNNRFNITFRANEPVRIGGIPSQVLWEDTPLSEVASPINLSLYTLDPDSYPEPVHFTATSESGGIACEIVDGHFLDLIPTEDFYGNERVRVTASDGASEYTYIFTVLVKGVNDPPSLSEFINITTVQGRYTVFNVTVKDPDSEELEAIVKGPFNYRWVERGLLQLNITPGNDLVGVSLFTLVVSDGVNNTTSTIVLEVKNVNDPPRAESPGRVEVRAGERVRIPINIEDPDGDPLTWEVIGDFRDVKDMVVENDTVIFTVPRGMKGNRILVIIFRDPFNATDEVEIELVISPGEGGIPGGVGSLSWELLIIVIILIVVLVGVTIWWERRPHGRPLISGWAREALPGPGKDLKSKDFKEIKSGKTPGKEGREGERKKPLTEDIEETLEEVAEEIFEEK